MRRLLSKVRSSTESLIRRDQISSMKDDIVVRIVPDHFPSKRLENFTQHHKNTRYVFAHVVQGNFQFYEMEDWLSDMKLAQEMGIDAFAINIGRDQTNQKQLPLIYQVAEMLSFYVFLSFDMVYCGQSNSSDDIIEIIQNFATRKSQFIYKGKPMVSTFSGEVPGTFLDNNPDYNSAWKSLKDRVHFPIYFLPCWTGVDPQTVSSADGMLSWDAWSPISSSQDRQYKERLNAIGKQYAAPISGIFYKHLSEGQSGNYLYPTDSWFLIEKFIELISLKPDLIEILSWNDYGESHYLRDPRPSANLPVDIISSEKYVNGMPHEPLLDLISYFNEWYKSGTRPVIKRSKAYIWYRPHPKDAFSKCDLLPTPDMNRNTEDNIYMVILLSSHTTLQSIIVRSGDKISHKDFKKCGNFYEKEDKILLISVPFDLGEIQTINFYDKANTLLGSLNGTRIISEPEIYNFNYWSSFIEL